MTDQQINIDNKTMNSKKLGQNIVVIDRGFVYVGEVNEEEDRLTIENARNIRRWGTTKGLGQLRTGPLETTILDEVGSVIVFKRSVLHLIPCRGF